MDAASALDYPQGLIGKIIEERYRIDSVLAQGGMGTVFKATHLSLQRPVALKILRPDLESDQTQRFLREANIVAQLEHRNCVTVFDHGRSQEGFHFIAMQLLKGTVLSQALDGAMDPVRAATLLLDALRGLEHAHSRNVVHRDLKPDNLFLTTDEDGNEVLKLLDFGIAKFKQPTDSSEGAVTLSGLMSGTPAYMSPEQVIGADTDERTDIYSAGVIFFEMLAGQLPFEADDPVVLFQHQLNEAFPPLPDSVPASLQEIIERMCDKEKAKRYPSASAVAADVEAFLVEATDGGYASSSSATRRWSTSSTGASSIPSVRGPVTSAGPGTGAHEVEGESRRPWWHWGLAAGLALSLGGVALPMLVQDDDGSPADAASSDVPAPDPGQAAAASPDASVGSNDRSGFLSLLAKVNDPDHPLPYDARQQSLQTLEGSEYAEKIDTRLHTGLDLVQAADSPTPCATFHDALTLIDESRDSYYVSYLAEAEVPEKGPTEPEEACNGLSAALSNAQTALIGEEAPQREEARQMADNRSSRRRAKRRRERPDEARPAPTSAPVAEPTAPAQPPKAEKMKPPAKVPAKSGNEAVTKLDAHDIRGL